MNEPCGICEKLRLAAEGRLPSLIHEFDQSILIAGDHQFYPGYCVLLAKSHAREMHELPESAARAIFDELMRASRAIAAAYQPHKLNHASLGNVVPHVHWHVFPRYVGDPKLLADPWSNAGSFPRAATTGDQVRELRNRIKTELARRDQDPTGP